jgi:hypothetical protein
MSICTKKVEVENIFHNEKGEGHFLFNLCILHHEILHFASLALFSHTLQGDVISCTATERAFEQASKLVPVTRMSTLFRRREGQVISRL